MKLVPVVIVICGISVACNNESTPTGNNEVPVYSKENVAVPTGVTPSESAKRTDNAAEEYPPPIKSNLVDSETDSVLVIEETEVKWNPPHGEQGHRCDIKVGTLLSMPLSPDGVNYCK